MRAWRLHIALVSVLVAQLATWAAVHMSDDEVAEHWASGSPEERVEALFLQANRNEPNPNLFDKTFLRTILAHETEERIREFMFTNDMCKFTTDETRGAYIYRQSDVRESPAHGLRCLLIHYRRVGSWRLELNETHWFIDAMDGRMPDMEALNDHMTRRITVNRQRRDLKEQDEAAEMQDDRQAPDPEGSDSTDEE